MKNLLPLIAALAIAGCGGGGEEQTVDALESAAKTQPRMRALAVVPPGADADLNAERLLDHAEQQYKELFPTAEPTRSLNGWRYRYYTQTGIFLAVINWRVFVVGGPFGPEVRDVGEVANYITITPPLNQAPTVSLALARAASSTTPGIVLTATAADADGTVVKVEFFNGSTKLGETTAAPHVLTVNNVGAGMYELTAKATDNGGLSASTAVHLLQVLGDGSTPPAASITVASIGRCSTALGSSSANSYSCLVGATPQGAQTLAPDKTCSMTISAAGMVTVSTEGQNYAVSVPDLSPTARNFTKTTAGMSFDYGSTITSASAIRIRARTEDKVLGQFFQQGGNLVIEVKRTSPAVDLSCTIPLAMS